MQELFKNYGSAIGPTLAFCLGILALFIKQKIDDHLQKKRVKSEFEKLTDLIRKSAPPKSFHPQKSELGLIHADQARNLTNIARFYNRLLGIAPLIEHIEKDIYRFSDTEKIRVFNNLKWWFSITLKDVESLREKGDVNHQDIMNANEHYKSMIEALSDPNQLYDYIEKT